MSERRLYCDIPSPRWSLGQRPTPREITQAHTENKDFDSLRLKYLAHEIVQNAQQVYNGEYRISPEQSKQREIRSMGKVNPNFLIITADAGEGPQIVRLGVQAYLEEKEEKGGVSQKGYAMLDGTFFRLKDALFTISEESKDHQRDELIPEIAEIIVTTIEHCDTQVIHDDTTYQFTILNASHIAQHENPTSKLVYQHLKDHGVFRGLAPKQE